MEKEEKRKRKAKKKDLTKRIRKEKRFIHITAVVAIVDFVIVLSASKNIGLSLCSAVMISLLFFWAIPMAIAQGGTAPK